MTAYVIACIDVNTPEDYVREYASKSVASVEEFGGRFLAKGGAQDVLEGNVRARNVIIAFDSMDAARNWYNSDNYQALRAKALQYSDRDMLIVEGV